ncbi:MAG: sulfatase family protein [Promethearchaeota archaeon]|jgi:choline-sulfatase
MTKKPNIILIFPDQHRGDVVGCMGDPVVITPNLDKLASEGVVFTQCFTNSPLCIPARATLMTGTYVSDHGIINNNKEASSLSQSHVRNIRDAGYHTAVIGKTHLYVHGGNSEWNHTNDKIEVLKEWGFDDIHEITGPIASIRNNSHYTDYLEEKGLLKLHRKYLTDYWVEWTRGETKPWKLPPSPLPSEDQMDSFTGQKAVEWIHNYKGENPFYLQICFPGPHDPFDSTQEYRDKYNAEEMPIGILEKPKQPYPGNIYFVLNWSGLDGMTEAQNQLMKTYYYGKITLIDEWVGKIMGALAEKGLADNTWIIYTSDHGEMLGDHMMSHKIVFYEGALRIPLIIRPPGGTSGWHSKGLSDQIDVAASLIDIAKAKPLENCDGRSLVPQILAGPDDIHAQKGRDVVFSQVLQYTMVRNEQYKLVVRSNNLEPVEFYDLKKDPKEVENKFNDPSMSEIIQNLINTRIKKVLKTE